MSNYDIYKSYITTFFGNNDILNGVEGSTIDDSSKKRTADKVEMADNIAKITYNLSKITTDIPKNEDINKTVSKNYLNMQKELKRYNSQNLKMMVRPHLYERIDDNGNLYEDLEPSITDARTVDSRELLLQQNTAYIIGSLVVSSFLIIVVSIY